MVSIEYVDLYKFQGMWLNKIQRFTLSDIKRYQLILGRNGCGKSRLIRVLSLMAPVKTDFDITGYRTLVVIKDNVNYKLHCVRTKASFKCTIEEDGVVIHDSVNTQVYNSVIKELFNYDKDIHDLITGKVLFTKMRTPERKKWFSILSESDLTFALDYYQKARTHLRDFSGAIKTIKHNIGILQPKVIDNREELALTKARIENMQAEITGLDIKIGTIKADPSITLDTLVNVEKRLSTLTTELLSTDVTVNRVYHTYTEEDVLVKLAELDATHRIRMSELSDLVKRIEHCGKIKNIDLDKVRSLITELQQQIVDNQTNIAFTPLLSLSETDLTSAASLLQHLHPIMTKAMFSLSDVSQPEHLDNITPELVLAIDNAAKEINICTNSLSRLNERLDTIDHTCEIDCTLCGGRFKPGVKADTRDKVLSGIAHFEQKMTQCQTLHDSLVSRYNRYLVAFNNVAAAKNMLAEMTTNPAIELLSDFLYKQDAFSTTNPKALAGLNAFKQDIDLAITNVKLVTRKTKVELDASVIEANQTEDYTELNDKRTALEAQVESCTKAQIHWRGVYDLIKESTARLKRLYDLDGEIADTLTLQETIGDTLVNNEHVNILSQTRSDVWDVLIATKQRFEDMDRERVRLENLEDDLTALTTRHDAAKQIVNALSPDGGILAKYLYQSITKVTDIMTGYINSIWGYEMGVMPCSVDGNELDYKFPFYANDISQVTDDVSLGSKAQQEVINFVFMLSVYRAMHLDGYPLFLDELGSGFDEGHKPSMIEFIKSLIESGHHSQVFMVSHDPETHFQLSHADVCVIDTNGITLPAVYNKNVNIVF